MSKPSQRSMVAMFGFMVIVGLVVSLDKRMARPTHTRPFFSPAPSALTVRVLGGATNYLKLDRDHDWKAFCVSNGTSKTLFYTVTEIEYQTTDGWRSAGSLISNTLTSAYLMTRRETAGEISPGATDVFFAAVAPSSIPWRLRLGCFESGWSDPLVASLGRARASIQGLPPPKSKSWTGSRYELICEEIIP